LKRKQIQYEIKIQIKQLIKNDMIMRINKLFFAGIATIGFLASCVNDEEVSQSPSSKDSVNVSLQLTTGTATTRTIGTLPLNTESDVTGSSAKESKINRICVGVFDASSNTVTIYEQSVDQTSSATSTSVNFNTTTVATKVIIAANAPEGWFKNIATENAFKAKAADLAYTTISNGTGTTTPTTVNSQLSTALPMYSAETALIAGTPMTATITLTRMVARVAITSITANFDATGLYTGASFTPTEVFMYNANTSCNWDGTYTQSLQTGESTTPIGTSWIDQTVLSSVTESLTDYSYLSTGAISSFTSGTLSSPYYFYVFPNSAGTPTKLVIKGTWYYDSKYSVVYYPIIINHLQSGTSINGSTTEAPSNDSQVAANTQYALTATIKGKGVSSPGTDINPAAISLTVSVNPWSTTSQDVTFE
jgi:hypothetical protein